MADDLIKSGEIPALFGKGPRWLERNLEKLREKGFPEPVSRGVYLRSAVIAFRDTLGRARTDELRGAVTVSLQMAPPHDAKSVRSRIARTLAHGR